MILMEGGAHHYFCPAKLFRDDPDFCQLAEDMWLAWKTGQVPTALTIGTMQRDEADMMHAIIRFWESFQRREDFMNLAQLLGGK